MDGCFFLHSFNFQLCPCSRCPLYLCALQTNANDEILAVNCSRDSRDSFVWSTSCSHCRQEHLIRSLCANVSYILSQTATAFCSSERRPFALFRNFEAFRTLRSWDNFPVPPLAASRWPYWVDQSCFVTIADNLVWEDTKGRSS